MKNKKTRLLPKKEKKTIQINLYTDSKTKEWISRKSQELGYSMSGFIHAIIDNEKDNGK